MSSLAYTIKESTKSKHVLLRVSYFDASLTVVIPKGFNRRLIPDVLQERQSWIERVQKQIAELRCKEGELPCVLPERVRLRAIGEEWHICYKPAPHKNVIASEKDNTLVLHGNVKDVEACKQALLRWLRRKSQEHLVPWLRRISDEQGLPVGAVRVGAQRTRWASCSTHSTISLNQKLLFLPKALVSYVMIHELCHIIHFNHSQRFWAAVEERTPQCQRLDDELCTAWRYVPAWVGRNWTTK